MEDWLIFFIVVSSVVVLLLLSFLVSYLTYRLAFYSNRKKENAAYLKKVMESYREYGKGFETLVKNLEENECARVFIVSDDGLKLSARYYHKKDDAPLHILFHGYRSRAEFDMSGGAYECMSLSHNVLLVDQRAHGMSEGKSISFGINERRDLLLWCSWAIKNFGEDVKIFLWGVSMGAATVLMSLDLPLPRNVIGAVADCPYNSPEDIIRLVGKKIKMPVGLLFPFLRLGSRLFGGFRLGTASAEKSVLKAKIPVLLIHGEADTFVPCEMSEKMAFDAKEAGIDLRFLKFENAPHAMSYLENAEKYRSAAIAFINEILERNN